VSARSDRAPTLTPTMPKARPISPPMSRRVSDSDEIGAPAAS
jgi:hypothetical protein